MPDVQPIIVDGNKKRVFDPLTDTIPGITSGQDHQNGFFRVKSGEKLTVEACRQSTTFGGILILEAGSSVCVAGQYRLRF